MNLCQSISSQLGELYESTQDRPEAPRVIRSTPVQPKKVTQQLRVQIEKRVQQNATNTNLEFVKESLGEKEYKKLVASPKDRKQLTKFAGTRGAKDARSQTEEMFQLITKSDEKAKRRLANKFAQQMEDGEEVDLKALINKELGITGRRAAFIARDQSSKYNSIIASNRMKEFDIDVYQWVAVQGDGRTRKLHQERHGKTFQVGTPTPSAKVRDDGPPGVSINCRCSQLPITNQTQRAIILQTIRNNPDAAFTGV